MKAVYCGWVKTPS